MPIIYPVAGGKGGIGKSFISANLGWLLAKQSKTVLLVDLDLGSANLHTMMGIKNPRVGLNDFLNKTKPTLMEAVIPSQLPGLFLLSAKSCPMEAANLPYAQIQKIINAINGLPFDFVLLDLGAGTHFNTLDFFLTSGKGIVVCTPEPTSIENAFRFIQAVYLRRLKQLIKQYPFDARIKTAVLDKGARIGSSADIMDVVLKFDPEKEALLKERIGRFQFKIVLNQFRKNTDPSLGEKIKIVCNRHFYSPFEILGRTVFDDRVIDSLSARKLFVQQYPAAAAAVQLQQVAELLVRGSQAPSAANEAQ